MTNKDDDTGEVFAEVVKNRREYTADEFFATLGYEIDAADRQHRAASDAEIRRLVREHMQTLNGGIVSIADLAGPAIDRAIALLEAGEIAAVDGTDATSVTDLMTRSMYSVATGWVTRRTRGAAVIGVTTTSMKNIDPTKLQNSANILEQIEAQYNSSRNNDSWPRTFREREERLTALRCPAQCVLIDGPIVTQNLLSQRIGRETLRQVYDDPRPFIGFIKELSGTMFATKCSGATLETGEAWVVGSVRDSMTGERRSQIAADIPVDYVRVVFRPNQRSFCLECRERDVPLACAISIVDRSAMPNHELPMLLEIIDVQLRSAYFGGQNRDANLDRMMREESYDVAINAMNERAFR